MRRLVSFVMSFSVVIGWTAATGWAANSLWTAADTDAEPASQVRVDVSALMRGPTPADSTFSITLPDGTSCQGVVEQTRIEGPERFVSSGRFADHPAGDFLFIVDHGRVAGTLGLTGDDRYCLMPAERPGVQRLTRQQTPGPIRAGIRPRGQKTEQPRRGITPAVADPEAMASQPIIDVLFLYTPRVLTVSGNIANVELAVDLAIAQANQAYADSGAIQRLRAVHLDQVDYLESGSLQTDLDRLTRAADGFMDLAFLLRNDYRADLVHLFLASGDLPELGWLNNFSTFNTTWTFSVSNLPFLANDAFTRAVGSNQGIEPDWVPLATARGAFPQYSFDYAFVGSSGQFWKTMNSNGAGTRIRRHSNPLLLFDGVPTGQPTTAAQPADAVQSLNKTSVTIAAIADGTIIPPPVISSPAIASGLVGQFFQYQITATNGPITFGAAGLPAGLSINTQSGLISGIPRDAGTYTVDLSANNSGGTGFKVLTLTIDGSSDCPVQRVARRLEGLGLAPPKWLGQAEPRMLQLCRRFRDDVLKATPEGRELVELYYRHRPAVIARLEQDPQLMRDAAACLVAMTPALEESRPGDRLVMTPSHRRQIDQWLDRFATDADAELLAAATNVQQWLDDRVAIIESR
jgi:hypothetical protein